MRCTQSLYVEFTHSTASHPCTPQLDVNKFLHMILGCQRTSPLIGQLAVSQHSRAGSFTYIVSVAA
jgi:hypothetical protein